MATYYGRKDSYCLDKQLGVGGEGSIYGILGKTSLVAKIYSSNKFIPTIESPSPREDLKEKIETMLEQPVDPYINGVLSVAWPQDILFDYKGQFVGYVMPRVNSSYHIYAASRERERKVLYPNYTWKTAILIAYNLALAVKTIHATNAIVGDFNPNNIMLDEKGHVTLIDTDSFNITNKRTGKTYRCSVAVAEMLPPELQGKDLRKTTSAFSKHTDSFMLAIHIFNLLMNNCHPFGCVGMDKSQSSASSNPVVHNIIKGNCPYVSSGKGTTSPQAPDFMMLPKEIRQLFDKTFHYNTQTAIQASTIANRPSAEEWRKALNNLYNSDMKICTADRQNKHLYPAHYIECPWCALKHSTPNTVSVRNSATNSGIGHSSGKVKTVPAPSARKTFGIRRDSWPLWLVCMTVGCICGPCMAQYLVESVYKIFEVSLEIGTARIILLIMGGISGAIVAHYGQEPYQTADNGWIWLLLGLLAPVLTVLMAAAILLGIFVIVLIVTLVLYMIGITIVITCICGMCSGG